MNAMSKVMTTIVSPTARCRGRRPRCEEGQAQPPVADGHEQDLIDSQRRDDRGKDDLDFLDVAPAQLLDEILHPAPSALAATWRLRGQEARFL